MKVYQNTDTADKHGSRKRTPILVPRFSVESIFDPNVWFILAHAQYEPDVKHSERGERDELQSNTGQEYLRPGCDKVAGSVIICVRRRTLEPACALVTSVCAEADMLPPAA